MDLLGDVGHVESCLQAVDLAMKANPCLQNKEHKQKLERT
jgi:hypothetical protein